ncbi:MAG: acetylglutamate kinase [Acidobacteriota bacterium]
MTQYDCEATVAGLMRALPYIRLYRGRVFVIKFGGSLIAEPEALRQVVEQVKVFQEVGIRVVLIHGGAPQTTALARKMGFETPFVAGRRVTTPQAMEAAVMALNGTANTAVLSACRAVDLPAIGMSCVDAGLVRARLRPPVEIPDAQLGSVTVDFGQVGDIASVDRTILDRLIDSGFVPIVSPVSADDQGRLLNINADTVASAIACAVDAEKLVFLTDTPGILENKRDLSSMVSCIDLAGLEAMEGRGVIDGGMLPKVSAARAALSGGVRRIHMVGFRQRLSLLMEIFTNEGAGTLVVRDLAALPPAEQGATPATDAGAARATIRTGAAGG